jgi:hypothetical protein
VRGTGAIDSQPRLMLNRSDIEDGVWPLVEAANASGYPTVSSCEGHVDERLASLVFFADNDAALKVQSALKAMLPELRCHWELSAGFIIRETGWVLSWRLDSGGITAEIEDLEEWWRQTTDAGRKDMLRLAEMFRALK